MKKISDIVYKKYGSYPERILQFGDGNFVRAFCDFIIEKANEKNILNSSIVISQNTRGGKAKELNNQNCIYTLIVRGKENGEIIENIEQITSVSRCLNPYIEYDKLLEIFKSEDLNLIISNTTESGIVYDDSNNFEDIPPSSYPARLTRGLYERFKSIGNKEESKLLILPLELTNENGTNLKNIILQYTKLWKLDLEFINWINDFLCIANTMVDRIVTGYPKDEIDKLEKKLGYEDNFITVTEPFYLFVIEAKNYCKKFFPIENNNIIWTNDVKSYKKMKVRILNGVHTAVSLPAYLCGFEIVLDFIKDELFNKYVKNILFDEILLTFEDNKKYINFANNVIERFENPYLKHYLIDISLNSCSKFAARCLPTILDYIKIKDECPKLMSFSLASFIRFYKGEFINGDFIGERENNEKYKIMDSEENIKFFSLLNSEWNNGNLESLTHKIMSKIELWNGINLTKIKYLEENVFKNLEKIEKYKDIKKVLSELLNL